MTVLVFFRLQSTPAITESHHYGQELKNRRMGVTEVTLVITELSPLEIQNRDPGVVRYKGREFTKIEMNGNGFNHQRKTFMFT